MSADDAAFELVCSKSSLLYDSDVIAHDDDDDENVDRQIIAQGNDRDCREGEIFCRHCWSTVINQ